MSWRVAWFAAAMVGLPGCLGSCDFVDQEPDFEELAPQIPPSVDDILVPGYPPLGPGGVVTARVSDDCCLSEVRFTFRNEVHLPASGDADTVAVSAIELGEGMGTLYVDAIDSEGLWAERQVQNLLVDLSPPAAEIGDTVIKADGGSIEVWAGDAWVLGSVALTVQGVTRTHTLPQGYPATLGQAWDHSLEVFSAADFPAGTGLATVTVTDAAGNRAEKTFTLVIDGSMPVATISSPPSGATVSGSFEVSIQAADAEGATTIELYAGDALIATGAGPEATFTIDAGAFIAGPIEITAVAFDAAGNESAPAVVTVVVE